MATTARNNIVRSNNPRSIFESAKPVLDDTVNYNQGDLIAFDTSSKLLKAVSSTGDAANFLGVAVQTIVDGKIPSPYTTAVSDSQAIEDVAGPQYGVTVSLYLNTGDTVALGQKVYLVPSDAQTVTVTDNSSGAYIGTCVGPAVTSAPSGTLINVLLGARYNRAIIT